MVVGSSPTGEIYSLFFLTLDKNTKGQELKKLVIMRGVSGSGKSTTVGYYIKASKRSDNSIKILVFSTDDFWAGPEGYNFDVTKLSEAHKWNQGRVLGAMSSGFDGTIIVDNTNLAEIEFEPYVKMAKNFDYKIELLEPDTIWWNEAKKAAEEFHRCVDLLHSHSTHGVPIGTIQSMLLRYQPCTTIE